MILLFLLICGHAIADFSLQSEYMALGKNKWLPIPGTPWYWPMTAHCLIHGFIVFSAITFFLTITTLLPIYSCSIIGLIFGVFEFSLHYVIDCIKCKKLINYDIDQILHIVCKIIYAIIILLII